jgi:hypothetical protein
MFAMLILPPEIDYLAENMPQTSLNPASPKTGNKHIQDTKKILFEMTK